jgi:hypothetical protein
MMKNLLTSAKPIAPVTGTFARNTTDANGNVTYSGIGFKPSNVIFFYGIIGSNCGGFGMTNADAWQVLAGVFDRGFHNAIYCSQGSAWVVANINSFTSDGFVLSWNKGSAPDFTLIVNYIAFP